MNYILRNRLVAALILFSVCVVPLSLFFISGCASKLQGEQFGNLPPEVGFINAPPESTNFSRNSVIYWWGTDKDGIIDYFRYHVATVDEMGGMAPDQYIAGMLDSNDAWVIVDVDVVTSEPGTESIIKLSADLNDPVNKYVLQYVFLQAFDEEGLASTIVWRVFGRNDNPPQTRLFNPPAADVPFVNAETPGGIITGVKMRWDGQDPIDYPSDPPPFDFHYKLYGPYTDAELAVLESTFFQKRYLTATGLVYKVGDTIITCDTTILISPPDTIESCDTLIVKSNTPNSAFGSLEDYFNIFDPAFDTTRLVYESNNPFDNTDDRIWVQRTADTIFNVFSDSLLRPDTTAELNFVFWVRCRDDALVPDLIPAFRTIRVLNPKFERGVLVIDATTFNTGARNWANYWYDEPVTKGYWLNTINTWAGMDSTLYLDTASVPGFGRQAQDYFWLIRGANLTPNYVPISWMLKHKLIILTKEGVAPGNQLNPSFINTLYKAIDAGVNVWVCMRGIGGGGQAQPYTEFPLPINYARYFGATLTVFSGWACHANGGGSCPPKFRIEDFIGAYPKAGWPVISIDKNRLRDKLRWATSGTSYPEFAYDSVSPHYGLPEVGWSIRTFGTELLYRYKSSYGPTHPLGRGADYDYIFEGAPVAHRLNAGLYRTVHCNFTPLCLDTITGQIMADSILNWLYDPNLGQAISKPRYPDAKLQTSIEEARDFYRQRVEAYELIKDEFPMPDANR